MPRKCCQQQGVSILDKYDIKVTPRAASDIDGIYCYIADNFKDIGAAERTAKLLDDAILSLDTMPHRGAVRKVGAFANKGYRQIFVNNFTIIYRIDEEQKRVVIVTARYTPSSF